MRAASSGRCAIDIPAGIFREYDIRGVVGTDLTEENVRRLGGAIALTFIREGIDRAVIGRDNRHSSDAFFEALADGLREAGIGIVDIGVVPTPVFYFAAKRWKIRGGVMITASHNPAEFNGFKILRGEGTIFGDDIRELHPLSLGRLPSGGARGGVERRDAVVEYIDHVASITKLERPVSFAADGGNGTAGIVAPALFARLGCAPVELFMEPDGRYPNHHPDPTVLANVRSLRAAVLDGKLELGVAFDGDSDRLGVIDNTGAMLFGDRLLALFARDVLAAHPGATVIFEVKCSEALIDDIARHGGRPIMWKAGHSLIKNKMREEKALLAGEMSGHLFFADRYYGYDDAIYAACRLLEIVSKAPATLAQLLADLPNYENTPEIRIPCEDDRKFDVVRAVGETFAARGEVITVDGARIVFDGGWGLVRASNTQPVLVLRFEARTRERLREIEREVADVLGEYVDVTALREE